MLKKTKEPIKAQLWFKQAIGQQEKLLMKQALARYLVDTGQHDEWPKPSVDACLEALPYFQKMAPRWAKVAKENFHPSTFPAHQAYFDQICNSLRSKRELKALVKEELAKLRCVDVTEKGGDTEDENP